MKLSIRAKLTGVILLLLLVALGANLLITHRLFIQEHTQTLELEAQLIGEELKPHLERMLGSERPSAEFEERIQSVLQNHERAAYVTLIGTEGQVLLSTGPAAHGTFFAAPTVLTTLPYEQAVLSRRQEQGETYYDVWVPLKDETNHLLGAIRVSFPADQILQPARRSLFTVAGLATFFLAVGLLLSIAIFSLWVQRPLQNLAARIEALRHADSIDLTQRIGIEAPAEVAHVSSAFDHLLADLEVAGGRLLHDALHDPLTNLPNRVLFMDRLSQAILRSKRHVDYRFGVLFLDMDHFKEVNDSYGHTIGDQLLVAFASRLRACARAVDTVARLAGDEFAILLEDIDNIDDATRMVTRIQNALAQPFELQNHTIPTSASIGIAMGSQHYHSPEEILHDADMALYQAKADGKARYAVFDTTMQSNAARRSQLEKDLQQALENEELQVYYQPVVALRTGEMVGLEALLRWHHPSKGVIMPSQFVPLAEESGLIGPIGRWVLFEACRQMREWQKRYPPTAALVLSVNLSRKQFFQPDLDRQLRSVLNETGLNPQKLRIEITESIVMDAIDAMGSRMKRLRDLGIQLQLDDFGTGFFSFKHLPDLPIQAIKIDRSFINQIQRIGPYAEMVRIMVHLAQHLGMESVAEGIETDIQRHWLTEVGCHTGQGYLFSKPLQAGTVEAFLAAAYPEGTDNRPAHTLVASEHHTTVIYLPAPSPLQA